MNQNKARKNVLFTNPCAIVVAALAAKEPLSRSTLSQYRQIAALDPLVRRTLDELGANLRQARWVASPGSRGRRARRAQVDLRYRALKALLEGASEHPNFQALCDAFPTYDPRSGAEIPPADCKKNVALTPSARENAA